MQPPTDPNKINPNPTTPHRAMKPAPHSPKRAGIKPAPHLPPTPAHTPTRKRRLTDPPTPTPPPRKRRRPPNPLTPPFSILYRRAPSFQSDKGAETNTSGKGATANTNGKGATATAKQGKQDKGCKAQAQGKETISWLELKRAAESVMRQVDWDVVAVEVAGNRGPGLYKRAVRGVLQGGVEGLVGDE